MIEYSLMNHIRNIRNAYLQTIAELVNYEWGYEPRNKQIIRLKERVLYPASVITKANWDAYMNNLDSTKVRELLLEGFKCWDTTDEDNKPLSKVILLVPLWLFLSLDKDIVLTSMDDSETVVGEVDNDYRFVGMLSYGVVVDANVYKEAKRSTWQ